MTTDHYPKTHERTKKVLESLDKVLSECDNESIRKTNKESDGRGQGS